MRVEGREAMSKTILVVDDEEAILEIIETNLAREGFTVLTADCGEQALLRARQGNPELILLDVGLPDMDGFTVCQKLRETTGVPVIMVTARGEDTDKIHGLETGADDYVVKPFNPKELVARIKAIFRRQEALQKPATNRLGYQEIEIDLLRRRVTLGGNSLDLTPKEYDLLTFLVSRPGQVLTREEILVEVWGSEHLDARSVDVHVRYLREKLGKAAAAYIKTVWGKGYRFGDG